MNSKTHLACGIAAALTLLHPTTMEGIILSVIGGSIGGVLPDIDLLSKKSRSEILPCQVIALWLAAVLLTADSLLHIGICAAILAYDRTTVLIGAAMFVACGVVGALTAHWTFTHSLFSAAVWIFCPLFLPAFAAGFLSHLVLDLLNYKKVCLFCPARAGLCLNLFHSDGTADTFLFFFCAALSLFLLLFGVRAGVKSNLLF